MLWLWHHVLNRMVFVITSFHDHPHNLQEKHERLSSSQSTPVAELLKKNLCVDIAICIFNKLPK